LTAKTRLRISLACGIERTGDEIEIDVANLPEGGAARCVAAQLSI
jgi:hypothetical protein